MSETCPLCHRDRPRSLEQIPVEVLDRLWRQQLGHSVRQEFGGAAALTFHRCLDCGLGFFTPPCAGSEALYERLQQSIRLYYMDEKPEYEVARRAIGKDADVLEVGAGKGAFAKGLNCRSYVGLELSRSAIAAASGDQALLLQEAVELHAERHAGRYDVICGFQVLEHVANVRSFIAACVACLRPGGRLIYSVPADDSYLALLPNAALNLPPHHLTRWPHRALHKLADLFQLEILALEHEPLCDATQAAVDRIRVNDYARVVALQSINRCLGRSGRLVDCSRAQRMVELLAVLASRLIALGLNDARLLPAGHSVTCIYRKP